MIHVFRQSTTAGHDSSLTHLIEIYPHGPNSQYNPYNPYNTDVGGLRASVNSFSVYANGGRYSADLGNITLPRLEDPNVGQLNGFVTDRGAVAANGRVNFDMFQNGSSRSSSTGYPLSGFASVPNKSDGYYRTGAVPSGSYKVYISDAKTGRKIILDGLNIQRTFERLDFQLEKRCFGYTGPARCIDPA